MVSALTALLSVVLAVAAPTLAAPVAGPIVRPFDATGRYSPGHRGVDIATPVGTVVRSPVTGTVSYAGAVAGNVTLSIEVAGGTGAPGDVVVHLSYLGRVEVASGAVVRTGDRVGISGAGHGDPRAGPSVHLGLEVDGLYVDPLPHLSRRRAVLVR